MSGVGLRANVTNHAAWYPTGTLRGQAREGASDARFGVPRWPGGAVDLGDGVVNTGTAVTQSIRLQRRKTRM